MISTAECERHNVFRIPLLYFRKPIVIAESVFCRKTFALLAVMRGVITEAITEVLVGPMTSAQFAEKAELMPDC